jgi:cytochrome oxidase Cu insertion factor (SCO1/SenC/PrrC family)
VLSGLLLAAVVVVALVVGPPGGGGGGAGASGGPAPGVSQAASDLLQLDVLAPSNRFVARAFTLTDQYGHPVRLGQFRGRPVVLSFNDDRCPDLCTLLAQDIVLADR